MTKKCPSCGKTKEKLLSKNNVGEITKYVFIKEDGTKTVGYEATCQKCGWVFYPDDVPGPFVEGTKMVCICDNEIVLKKNPNIVNYRGQILDHHNTFMIDKSKKKNPYTEAEIFDMAIADRYKRRR